jgi:hypothetical protein
MTATPGVRVTLYIMDDVENNDDNDDDDNNNNNNNNNNDDLTGTVPGSLTLILLT